MKLLTPDLRLDDFFRSLTTAYSRALLLDYDGTLAPFKVERDMAFPYTGVRKALSRIIESRETRLVIISGRGIKDLVPLLQIEPLPEIWGGHGWERLDVDGNLHIPELPEPVKRSLARAAEAAKELGLESQCERKAASVAIHGRGFDPKTAESNYARIQEEWKPLTETTDLEIHPFDGGIELRFQGRHKGNAVETILGEMPPDTVAAYLGDDTTDEDAFRAIKQRKGLAVLVREEFRETVANVWLTPPVELLQFFTWWRLATKG